MLHQRWYRGGVEEMMIFVPYVEMVCMVEFLLRYVYI
jgi:hypothetical protein